MRFNEAQLRLYKDYRWFRDNNLPVRIVICKARRAGLSTGVSALIYDDTTTNPNSKSLIVANEKNPSENVLGMYTRFWKESPEYFDFGGQRIGVRPALPPEYNNSPPKDRLLFAPPLDAGIYVATARSIDAFLGYGFQNIHATEASRYVDGHELFRSLYPTLSSEAHSALYIESTPNGQEGKGRWFYEQCMDAQARKDTQYGEMRLVFIPWHEMTRSFAVPFQSDEARQRFSKSLTGQEKDLLKRFPSITMEQFNWRRMVLAGPTFNRDEDMFDQEYPCLIYGTLVGTNLGVLPIEQVSIGAVTASGIVQGIRATGDHECVLVETYMGYTIECTLTHPIATTDGKFVAAGNALHRQVELQAPLFRQQGSELSPEAARWFGYYMGDGSLYKTTVEFVSCDGDVTDDILKLTKDIWGSSRISRRGQNHVAIRHSAIATSHKLIEMGCAYERESGKTKRRVCVPEAIWRSGKDAIREFLRGLFEADGSTSKIKRQIRFFSKDEQFSRDVQLLLLGFGIHAMRRRVFRRTRGMEYPGYEITLWSLDSQRFIEQIGFVSARKNKAFTFAPGRRSGRAPRDASMQDTVVAVTPTGVKPVYDLDIVGTHVFDANGILVHNTDLATAFLLSGHSVFGRKAIKRLMSNVTEPAWEGDIYWGESDKANEHEPIHDLVRRPHFYQKGEARALGFKSHVNEGTYSNLKVYRWPQRGERLFITCDVGGGNPESRDGDYSVIMVGVLNELGRDELIMTWRGHINPIAFGEVVSALSWAVRSLVGDDAIAPELVPEWNGPGAAMCVYIDNKNLYPNLYRWQPFGKHKMQKTNSIGWQSDGKTKPFMVGATLRMIDADLIDIPDKDLVLEMSTYRQLDNFGDAGSFGGAAGRHDDMVSAFQILCAMLRIRSSMVPGEQEVEEVEVDSYDSDLPSFDPFRENYEDAIGPGVLRRDLDDEGMEETLFWSDRDW